MRNKENLRLQWRRFREFRNTETDIENNSQLEGLLQSFFMLKQERKVKDVKKHNRSPLLKTNFHTKNRVK